MSDLMWDSWSPGERGLYADLMTNGGTEKAWQPTVEELVAIARKSASQGYLCYAEQVENLVGFMTPEQALELKQALKAIPHPGFPSRRRKR